jgi:hypothetical protein
MNREAARHACGAALPVRIPEEGAFPMMLIPGPMRFDWKGLMEAARRNVEAKATRRELSTKDLRGALDVLRGAAMRSADAMLNEGDANAQEAAEWVAYSLQALAFVLKALDKACGLMAYIAELTDKETLLGRRGADGDIHGRGTYAANKARQMSLPFLRGKAAVEAWLTFLLDTRLAPDASLALVVEAMNEIAMGQATDFFRHPETPLGGAKVDSLHDSVRRLAVMAVEALLKADEIEHGAPPKGAKRRACEEVAKAFPPTYRLPSSKAPGVTARHVAQWHENFGPLLRGEEARGARSKGFTEWHRARWRESASILRGEHPGAPLGESAGDPAVWRAAAVAWCRAIAAEIAAARPAE